jgi:hypothetical protein
MPDVLDGYEFRGRGPAGESPYKRYLDGQVYRFGPDERPQAVKAGVLRQATKVGMKLRTNRPGDGSIILQAYTPNGSA